MLMNSVKFGVIARACAHCSRQFTPPGYCELLSRTSQHPSLSHFGVLLNLSLGRTTSNLRAGGGLRDEHKCFCQTYAKLLKLKRAGAGSGQTKGLPPPPWGLPKMRPTNPIVSHLVSSQHASNQFRRTLARAHTMLLSSCGLKEDRRRSVAEKNSAMTGAGGLAPIRARPHRVLATSCGANSAPTCSSQQQGAHCVLSVII